MKHWLVTRSPNRTQRLAGSMRSLVTVVEAPTKAAANRAAMANPEFGGDQTERSEGGIRLVMDYARPVARECVPGLSFML
jgi:hypothetical protein